jgi:hypothetical protein
METQKIKKVHADDLHFEHKLWTNQLGLYSEQLIIFQNRLDEIARQNTSKEIMMQVEQYQNKFVIQQNYIDKLLQEFRRDEQHLAKVAQANTVAFDHRLFQDHEKEREQMEIFIKLYTELKNEFYEFLAARL